MKASRIAIVNRFYPPNQSATGYYGHMLAKQLKQVLNVEVHVYCQKGDYHNIHSDAEDVTGHHHYSRTLYRGRTKWIRLLSSFVTSFVLIVKARWSAYDFYIVMTDPPFNNFWAALLLKKESYAIWTMDLYPDAFVANGLVNERNIFNRTYRRILKLGKPLFLISLGPQQASYLRRFYPDTSIITIPIGLKHPIAHNPLSDSGGKAGKIVYAYVGNIGEAHDAQALIEMSHFINGKDELIIAVYGSKSSVLKSALSTKPNVKITARLTDLEMKNVDVQIVSLKEEWTHICVPSKTLSAVQHGSAVLFLGSDNSDSWHYIKTVGWQIDVDRLYVEKIKTLIEGLSKERVLYKKLQTSSVSARLQEEFDQGMQEILDKIRIKIT